MSNHVLEDLVDIIIDDKYGDLKKTGKIYIPFLPKIGDTIVHPELTEKTIGVLEFKVSDIRIAYREKIGTHMNRKVYDIEYIEIYVKPYHVAT